MDFKEKQIKSELIYNGKVVKLFVDDVKCPNNNLSKREIIKHNGGVCILGIIDNKVILEKQYRYAYDEVLYELPAGKLEINEKPYDAALREFVEETGFIAEELIDYGKMYPTCGYSNEIIYMYVAKNIKQGVRNLDEDEFIEIEYVELDKVIDMINKGIIKDAKTICLIGKYMLANNK